MYGVCMGFERADIQYVTGAQLALNVAKANIENYALGAISALQFEPGDPLEPVVESLGGRIETENVFSFDDAEATIWVHAPYDFDVVMNDLGYSRRNRFTLAHEVGHYLLHSKQGKIPMQANRSGTGRVEWEANWFAAALLMPRPALETKRSLGINKLADYFGVSEAAMRVRFKSLGWDAVA